MSKKCSWCGEKVNVGLAGDGYYCPHCNENLTDKDVLPMTVFEQITDSPDVLAEDLVYSVGKVWASTLIVDTTFDSLEEAIAATVAKLKEMEK